MLKISLLCNAGLALDDGTDVLLIDIPNLSSPPFYGLPEQTWLKILDKTPPYDRVCGLYFTHEHPDHCYMGAVRKYLSRWPDTPVFLPQEGNGEGIFEAKGFRVQYCAFPHAPLPEGVPPHVVTWISAGERQLYLASDAALDWQLHRAFLRGRTADCAFWNATYLSYEASRALMHEAAKDNYIYHMPAERPDGAGIWKKCENNFRRYGDRLQRVRVLGAYPVSINV